MDDTRSPAAPEPIDTEQFATLDLRTIAAWQARSLADPQASPFVADANWHNSYGEEVLTLERQNPHRGGF
jgi:hypothetical protein